MYKNLFIQFVHSFTFFKIQSCTDWGKLLTRDRFKTQLIIRLITNKCNFFNFSLIAAIYTRVTSNFLMCSTVLNTPSYLLITTTIYSFKFNSFRHDSIQQNFALKTFIYFKPFRFASVPRVIATLQFSLWCYFIL